MSDLIARLSKEAQRLERIGEVVSSRFMQEAIDALSQGIEAERARCAACVPHSWLDPLVSGKGAALGAPTKTEFGYTGPQVEKLLEAIRVRIAAAPEAK